jgi:competence protein ComEC
MNHRLLSALLLVCLQGLPALGQANGHLQLHFINVGQGDGAILISPGGETVLFDNGVRNDCDRVVAYLQQLGVTAIDYHVASHYHDDHIGCTVPVLREFPLRKTAYDRGGTYSTATFRHYTNSVAGKRKTAIEGAALTLDANSTHPVRVEFVALNGNGIQTLNENDLSLVSVVRFGQFDAVMGGDLSGYRSENYKDIETSVARSARSRFTRSTIMAAATAPTPTGSTPSGRGSASSRAETGIRTATPPVIALPGCTQ